jgi:hypothetical protein
VKNLQNNDKQKLLTPAEVLQLQTYELIKCIAAEQVCKNSYIPDGFFLAWRYYPFGYKRIENTIFNTAITLFQLKQVAEYADEHEQALIQHICNNATISYPKYLSRTGKCRYNFWQTNPDKHFPNGHLLGKFARFRPADDADDTVMAYLTAPHTPEQIQWLRTELNAYANGVKKWSKSMPKGMERLPVYSTFFVDKMDVSADVCVLSNILFWVYANGFIPNEYDQASLDFIARCIAQNLHLNHPVSISRYYPDPVVIIYHIARLIQRFNPSQLMYLIPQLMADIQYLLHKPLSFMQRVLVCSALIKLGGKAPAIIAPPSAGDFATGFSYFAYPITVEYKNPLLHQLSALSATHMRFYCKAFFLSLVLEYKYLISKII